MLMKTPRIEDKVKMATDKFPPFLTNFCKDSNLIRKIIQRNWNALRCDRVVGPVLPEKPRKLCFIGT